MYAVKCKTYQKLGVLRLLLKFGFCSLLQSLGIQKIVVGLVQGTRMETENTSITPESQSEGVVNNSLPASIPSSNSLNQMSQSESDSDHGEPSEKLKNEASNTGNWEAVNGTLFSGTSVSIPSGAIRMKVILYKVLECVL